MHRVVGATEIAESDLLLRKTFSTFLKFERSTCNTRVVFPWLPTPLYVLRLFSATILYVRILRILNRRKKEDRREKDALALLTVKGETSHQVAEVSGLGQHCSRPENGFILTSRAVRLHRPRSGRGHYFLHHSMAAHLPGPLTRVEGEMQRRGAPSRGRAPKPRAAAVIRRRPRPTDGRARPRQPHAPGMGI